MDEQCSQQVHELLFGRQLPAGGACDRCSDLEERIAYLEQQVALLRQSQGPERCVLAPGRGTCLSRTSSR